MKNVRIIINLLLIIALLCLVGCGRKGPNADAMKKELQQKLDENFQKGLFEVKDLSRRGSYSYKKDGSPDQRLLLYYKANIRFLQDYKLSDWDTLNVGSLVSVFGATPKGIKGIKNDGNKKDDALIIYGTSSYVYQEGKWISELYSPSTAKEEQEVTSEKKRYDIDQEENYLQKKSEYLEQLKKYEREFARRKDKENLELMRDDVKKLLTKLNLRSAKVKGWTTIVTGSPSGEYYALGTGLAKIVGDKNAKAYPSSGSVENCRSINENQATFGLVQNDIAFMAYKGSGFFAEDPCQNLRAICALYPEAMQVVVRKDSNIKKIEDLAGKNIHIDVKGSGGRANTLQILKAYGLKTTMHESRPDAAVQKLKDGKIDAMFLTYAYPARLLQNLTNEVPLRFLSLNETIGKELVDKHSLISLTIPKNTYIGMESELATVGVTAIVVTHKDTPDKAVQNFLKNMFKKVPQLSKASIQAHYISKNRAKAGIAIPFHPASEKFFKK